MSERRAYWKWADLRRREVRLHRRDRDDRDGHGRGGHDDRDHDRGRGGEESRRRCWEPNYRQPCSESDPDPRHECTHKEGDLHVLVVQNILSMSFKLSSSATTHTRTLERHTSMSLMILEKE